MPIISSFYGIIVKMYYIDTEQHHFPHLHVEYNEYRCIFDLNGKIIEGKLPIKQKRITQAWIEIHKEELNNLWNIVVQGKGSFRIEPLK